MDNNHIKIAVTGDFCPVYDNGEYIQNDEYEKAFGNFLEHIAGKDLHITNLEAPLTDSNNAILKHGPHLKASPNLAKGLTYAGVDVACLANNHILDYGEKGVFDTMDNCQKIGIKTVGAGMNLEKAASPLYLTIKGRKLAIINFTENEFTIATENGPGANPYNIVRNHQSISEARKKADTVIVIIHGGNEYYHLPSTRVVEGYRFLADAGADVVVGHHPHVYGGYEVHNGVPIFYSIGNYIFGWDSVRPDNEYIGLLLLLDVDPKGAISFELKPFYQSKPGIGFKVMDGKEKEDILRHVDELSAIIADKGKLEKEWALFCESKKVQYYNNLYGLNKVTRRLFKMPGFKQFWAAKRKKLMLLNMIDCEAHKDVSIKLLKDDIKS